MSTTFPPMFSSDSTTIVEISVQDPATLQERVFRFACGPLLTHMRYFEPFIKRQMNGTKAVQTSTSTPPEAAADFTLRARCDHVTFQWLIDWMSGKSPPITKHNVVSICLSSSFLQMQELFDNALMFLSAHLQDIVFSAFDLRNLPTHLVLRLSNIVRDTDLAATLIRLYEEKSAHHPNRIFVASLLQHYVCRQIGIADGAEFITPTGKGTAGTDDANEEAGSLIGSPGTSSGDLTLPLTSSLRWCCLCGTLFDEGEMHRLCRASKLSAPQCLAETGHAPCIGPRGELFTTHTAAQRAMPIVLEAPPPLKSGGVGVAAFPVDERGMPSYSAELERWAWRIIGAIRFVGCRRCFHLVSLIDVPKHQCSDLPPRFSSPDNAAGDINYLVRWFNYCAEGRVYEHRGGLTPMRYRGRVHKLADEVVEVPMLLSRRPVDTYSGATARRKGTKAVGKAVPDGMVEVSTSSSPITAVTSQHRSSVGFWATMPFYVREVMDNSIVDIDILNHVERQHRLEVEAQQRKASASQSPFPLSLSVAPGVAGSSQDPAGAQPASSCSLRPLSAVNGVGGGGTLGRGRAEYSGDVTSSRPRKATATARYGALTSVYRL